MTDRPASLPFKAPWLLAPMEGVTDGSFRDLILDLIPSSALGGAFTEFVRVVDHPVSRRVLQKRLGSARDVPVGLQLMGADPGAMAATAQEAVAAGAPIVDLNFGCPARGALRGRAGSALLTSPRRIEDLVNVCRMAIPGALLTAKIRAGLNDDSQLEDVAHAIESGGADMVTIHCRTTAEGFQPAADWQRIARTVSTVSIPVCGNGGIEEHVQLDAMRRETGCQLVMVGRAALGNPWIFTGHQATRREALGFLLDYGGRIQGPARLKQLLGYWTAGDISTREIQEWLTSPDPRGRIQASLQA